MQIFRSIHRKFLLLIAAMFVSGSLFAQDPNFYIFLCFGQSNMEGQGDIQAQDRVVNSRFKVLAAVDCTNLGRKKGSWYNAVPPLTRCWNGLSPADYFGRTLLAQLPDSIKVGIINVSVGGCKIELFDKDGYQSYVAGVTEDWLKNMINEYGGNPYGRLVDMAKIAQKSGVIKGILLHQGESNTGDTQWPTKVKKVYNNLMADLELSPDSVPILAGEVVHAEQGGICASMNTIINRLPNSIPNAHVISSRGCTDKTDNLHFNTAGYRELGKRYGEKMLTLLGYPKSTVGVDLLEVNTNVVLNQNVPNPFSDQTSISFEIPETMELTLSVYNVWGAEVKVLSSKTYEKGAHSVQFDASGLPSGMYLYVLKTNGIVISRKMNIMR